QSSVMFVLLGLQLNSDMSMRIYSTASIAENPMLAAVYLRLLIVAPTMQSITFSALQLFNPAPQQALNSRTNQPKSLLYAMSITTTLGNSFLLLSMKSFKN